MKNRYIILAALSVLLYLPSLFGGFMWDDEDIITGDPVIHSISNAPRVFTPGYWKRDFPGAESRYRPLRSLLLMAEWKAWGNNPQGYHAVRIVLNAAAVCLAFWLSFLLLKDPDKAFAAALIFAVHPAHVESVAWLKNVTDILVFIFTVLSAGLLLKPRAQEDGRGGRLAALLFFGLALASKENAVMMPALVLAWLCLAEGVGLRAASRRLFPEAALAALFLVFAVFAVRRGPALPAFDLKISLAAFAQYLRILFLPFDLNADRGLVTVVDIMGPLLAAGAAGYFWRRDKAGVYSVAWMLLCLVPFLDSRFITGRPIAEQRLYTASLGLGLAAGALYGPGLARRALLGLAALVLAGVTVSRTFDWISPVRFWEKTVSASPYSARARNNLGVSYERAGRLNEAAAEYGKAVGLDPATPTPYLNMADLLYKLGKTDQAEKVYADVFVKTPGGRRAGLGLLRLQLETGGDGAGETLEALLAAHPDDHEVLNSAGVVSMLKGDKAAAAAAFARAIAANPEYAEAHYNLAMLHQRSGDLEKAAAAYEALLLVNPRHADALNNLAIIRDMAGDEAGAIRLLLRAGAVAPGYHQAAYNLGGIYFRKKLYLEALSEYARVLRLKPDHPGAAQKAAEIRRIIDEAPKK